MAQRLLFTADIAADLEKVLSDYSYDRLFVLTDENTHRHCLPVLADNKLLTTAEYINIRPDDTYKTLETLSSVWQELSSRRATRHSILINLGGGMVTDLGGFAAATFKRGIRFINIPTTLLGAVDAAVGGKTGINFNDLKNEIGVFAPAEIVLISAVFFKTLSREHLLSGFAEMLKHGLISDADIYNRLFTLDLSHPDNTDMLSCLKESIQVKQQIVEKDPYEANIRKSLNFGHTIGHAFETFSHHRNQPVQHGYAVAWGIVGELLLSHRYLGFPLNIIRLYAAFVRQNYGVFPITCKDYDYLYERMTHDKKNEADKINFTLLSDIGKVAINQIVSHEEINIALDLYRDLFGI
ncbi:MAG: 3-dehydroquinate synthase [Porphyromonadaceae bacterium]|nr:3-dehydroquinate synthase [Porphyromonadaceae bacterium]